MTAYTSPLLLLSTSYGMALQADSSIDSSSATHALHFSDRLVLHVTAAAPYLPATG